MSPAEERAHHRLAAERAGLQVPEFVSPEHHHAVLGGLRLHYLDWGTAGRLPALFLHGGGQTARTWDLPCLALRGEFHCLALDQRGHGDSEWSPTSDYAPEQHAEDFLRLLDALAIERAVVVGMSMGCLNGLTFAALHPERVAAFVAVDAGPWVRVEGAQPIIDFVTTADGGESLEAFVEHALRFNPRRDRRLLEVSLRHNLRVRADGRLTWKTDRREPLRFERMRDTLAGLRERLAAIDCPTLVLRGAESEVFLDEHAARFAEAVPQGRWERVEGAGHTIQGDAPGALVAAIRRFLGLAPSPERPPA
ncbi:MAG: alpha/beta hydrolase [Proteobacteria bacterium]|nr:alpha/beta hydrolase [Pseudomonadota bacterium]